LVGLLQLLVFGLQARRLRETIDTMRNIDSGQSAKVQATIDQAARTAAAMEKISEAMADNVESIRESVATSKQIAARQKEVTELQLRAYLSVVIGLGLLQDRKNGVKFEAQPLLVNNGHTPANKVITSIQADILPSPLGRDYVLPPFPGRPSGEGVIPAHQNRVMSGVVDNFIADQDVADVMRGNGRGLFVWGSVSYEDAFKQPRTVEFCQQITWLPDGRIWGYYPENRNRAD
jgi:hypothetical protein